MEHSHTHQPVEDIINRLSECGYRMTPQRELILNAIENSREHISAEEIYAEVVRRYPHINISTVYRTLDLLKKLNLVTETDLGGGRYRYHPADKGHHHHLVCQECGATIDLEESALSSLKSLLLQKYGFMADLKHMAIMGRCVDCKKSFKQSA
jgi:Fur family ferric uptake transcriptional regulator